MSNFKTVGKLIAFILLLLVIGVIGYVFIFYIRNCNQSFIAKDGNKYIENTTTITTPPTMMVAPENFSRYSPIEHFETDDNANSKYTPGLPSVDMKNPLRRGSDLIRGDIPIRFVDSPIVGNSRLHENKLTNALFY